MLLELARWLAQDVRAFNVFNYITLRAVLAMMSSLAICWMFGPMLIRKLTEYKIGQAVRDDGPKSHLTKAGTPTMGGALILIALGVTTLLWADLSNRYVWVVLIVTLGFGAVGWSMTGARWCIATRRDCRRSPSSSGPRCSPPAPRSISA